MTQIHRFSPMEVEEKVVLTFQFASELNAAWNVTLQTPVSVEVISIGPAKDITPAEFVTSNQIDGTNVLVAVAGRVKGARYELRVTSNTTDPDTRLTRVAMIETR